VYELHVSLSPSPYKVYKCAHTDTWHNKKSTSGNPLLVGASLIQYASNQSL
jgi:hypothetical protein